MRGFPGGRQSLPGRMGEQLPLHLDEADKARFNALGG